jgi:hypothetical protein
LDLGSVDLSVGSYVLQLVVSDGEAIVHDNMNLVIGNTEPYIALSGGGAYGLHQDISLNASISDYDGDLITYEWSSDIGQICSGSILAVSGGSPVSLATCYISDLSLGSHFITLETSDGFNTVSDQVQVDIVDGTAPTMAPTINTNLLWPPNHKMVDIMIYVNANDNSGEAIVLSAEISSNEPEEDLGDGDASPDWSAIEIDQEAGIIHFQLRSERSGAGNGREYIIRIVAEDSSENTAATDIQVVVPHDKRKK